MKNQSQNFPLLNECFRQTDNALGLFPILKDWDASRLDALLVEIEAADNLSEEAYGELATSMEYFFSRARSKSLDEARMEVFCILSEIAAVAYHFRDRQQETKKEANA